MIKSVESRRAELLEIERNLGAHAFPPQLIIESTSECNLKCIHCSHKEMKRPKRPMGRELFNKIVEEVGRESPHTEVWPTLYGEALLLGDELFDRLNYAHQVGCQNIILNSNGTLLERDENIEKILNSPLKRFILSLDGLSKESFEKIRARARWDRVYPAVEELCRKRHERNQKYPVIIAQMAVMEDNEHEVADFRTHWHNRGAEVKIRMMLEWTATGTVRSSSIDHSGSFRIACPWANNTMAVRQDGEVATCAVDYEGQIELGNARDFSIKELWAKLGEAVRKPHLEHRWNDIPEVCKGCGDWQAVGASYDEESVENTRPFWFYKKELAQ